MKVPFYNSVTSNTPIQFGSVSKLSRFEELFLPLDLYRKIFLLITVGLLLKPRVTILMTSDFFFSEGNFLQL